MKGRALGYGTACLIGAVALLRGPEPRATIVRAAEADRGPAEPKNACSTEGQMSLTAKLDAHAEGSGAFAHFANRSVALGVVEVPATFGDRLKLRVRGRLGFSLEGWVERSALTFSARRRIPLADTAWIARGTRLSVKVGFDDKLVVAPESERLEPTETTVRCTDVAIGQEPDDPNEPPRGHGRWYRLVNDRLAIAPAPGAPPTFTLHALKGSPLTLDVRESPAGLHLVHTDGITVDGWIQKGEITLAPGAIVGFGCGYKTFSRAAAPAVGTRLARARRRTTVFAGGVPHGALRVDAEVLLLEVQGSRASILPRCREVLPEGEASFIVDAADLELGPLAPPPPHHDDVCH